MTKKYLTRFLLFSVASLMTGCASSAAPPHKDVTDTFSAKPEIDRLGYFQEIHAMDALKKQKLTGKGVTVTIMGEMVDAAHPDLKDNVRKQYNAFSEKGKIIKGDGNLPYGAENLGPNDGHGTHIAGIIAAACDGIGLQGLACQSSIDVYNLGAYDDSDKWPIIGWDENEKLGRFFGAYGYAMQDLAKRGESRITTGSFNTESPAIHFAKGGTFNGKSVSDLIALVEKGNDVDALIDGPYAVMKNSADREYLKQIIKQNDNDLGIALMAMLPVTKEWAAIEDAIADYQAKDGVYIVTESNYHFDDHSSTLNAMPSLSDKVDPDLWLSVVMVVPKGMDKSNIDRKSADMDRQLDAESYDLALNSCGEMAADYCILTPSWRILSTMTDKVAFRDGSPLFVIDERSYQMEDGHSMGAPMVAATLALMEEYNKREGFNYSMKDLVRILKANADRSFKGYDPKKHGVGILDVSAAIDAMKK